MTKNINNIDKSLLWFNLYILEKIGLIHSSQKYINMLGTTNNVLLIMSVSAGFADCCQEIFFKEDMDINLILTNLRFTSIGFITIVKINTIIKWRKSWHKVFDYVNQCDFEERRHGDAYRKKIVERYTKYNKLLSYGYFTLTIATAIMITIATIILIILRDEGSIFPHPFSMWAPFDKNTSPGCWILFIWSICMLFYVGFSIYSFDGTSLLIMNFLEKKLDLMQYECTSICKFGEDHMMSDEEFKEKIKVCHDAHNEYIYILKLFNTLISPALFLYVVMCSLFICTTVFQLSDKTGTVETIMNFQFLIFSICQLYMICLFGNDVYQKSLELSYGVYNCDWWALDTRKRRLILLLQGKYQTVFIFTAGPFSSLTMSTFIAILKGAYSYFTLVRQ